MMYMFPPFQAFVLFPWLPGLPDPEFFWCIFTGFRAKASCLLVHAEASVSLSGVSFLPLSIYSAANRIVFHLRSGSKASSPRTW